MRVQGKFKCKQTLSIILLHQKNTENYELIFKKKKKKFK